MPSTNYWIPAISAVTAIFTGFGAAGVKRRWDVQDDRRRWERERAERRREEIGAAFNDYLSARAEIEDMRLPEVDDGKLAPAINTSTRRFNQLWVLIDDRDTAMELVNSHKAFISYCRSLGDFFHGDGEKPIHEGDEDVRQLARRVLDP